MSVLAKVWAKRPAAQRELARRGERELARKTIGSKPTYLPDPGRRERWATIKAMDPRPTSRYRTMRPAPPKEVVTGTRRAVMHHSTRAKRAKADRAEKERIPLVKRQADTQRVREMTTR